MIPDFSPEIKLCESEAALIKKIHRRKKLNLKYCVSVSGN